jgi:anti-anti-sigma regulatory factor
MEIKINTKEKFTVIAPITTHLTDKFAQELQSTCLPFLEKEIKNIVLNLASIATIDEEAANTITQLQQQFYEKNTSFVICQMSLILEEAFDKLELLEMLNTTPTESEAWDIVQMEEIERELMDGF